MRPADLPEFDNPPVNEVYLGVQFARSERYQEIFAKDIWDLFRNNFPIVSEQVSLPPNFETFGLPFRQEFSFDISPGPQHTRYWFSNSNKSELLQFQGDRFIHNWIKGVNNEIKYPRFDNLVRKFSSEVNSISKVINEITREKLSITQFEVSYTNLIASTPGVALEVEDWLKQVSLNKLNIEFFSFAFKRTVEMPNDQLARLHVDANGVLHPTGGPALSLSLVVRGAPFGDSDEALVENLCASRDIIVRTFTDITTDSAHKAWKRTK